MSLVVVKQDRRESSLRPYVPAGHVDIECLIRNRVTVDLVVLGRPDNIQVMTSCSSRAAHPILSPSCHHQSLIERAIEQL